MILQAQEQELFEELVDGVQDDSGVIMLMQCRASRFQRFTSRSRSEPPDTRYRERAYYARHTSRKHPWIVPYHLCPYDSRWQFSCDYGESFWTIGADLCGGPEPSSFELRSCVAGSSNGPSSVQMGQPWKWSSFLACIAYCKAKQASVYYYHITPESYYDAPESMRHSVTSSCPQGCSKIDQDLLDVLLWGPRTQYDNIAVDV